MQWAIFALILFGLFLTWVIFQETRMHRHWRGLVATGDLNAIRTILEQEIERWKTMRVPKGTPASLWHGVQTVELTAIGPTAAQVSCAAEGEYRFVGGQPEEVTTALEAAKRVAARVAEMILYDVPNLRLGDVRVDVYSTFRSDHGRPEQRCILSVSADRGTADDLDWEALRPAEIIDRLDTRYEVNNLGQAEPIDPGPPLEGTEYVAPREGAVQNINAEPPF